MRHELQKSWGRFFPDLCQYFLLAFQAIEKLLKGYFNLYQPLRITGLISYVFHAAIEF